MLTVIPKSPPVLHYEETKAAGCIVQSCLEQPFLSSVCAHYSKVFRAQRATINKNILPFKLVLLGKLKP